MSGWPISHGIQPHRVESGLHLARARQDMPQFFAFLRAINAGPKRAARMSVLRQTFESLGFFEVATFLGSGNVVFETRAKDVRRLEKTIESELKQALGYSVPVFIRTHAELEEIVASDGRCRQIASLQVNAITNHHGAIKGKTWF